MSVGSISKYDRYKHKLCGLVTEHRWFFDQENSFKCPGCENTDGKIKRVRKSAFTNLQSTTEDTSPASDLRKIERKNGVVASPIDPNMIPIADEHPECWLSLSRNQKKPPKRIQETPINDEIQAAILERIEKEEKENNAEVENLFEDGKYTEVITRCRELIQRKITKLKKEENRRMI